MLKKQCCLLHTVLHKTNHDRHEMFPFGQIHNLIEHGNLDIQVS